MNTCIQLQCERRPHQNALKTLRKKSLFLKTNETKYLYFRRKVYVVNVMNVVQSNDYISLMSSSYEMSYRVCLSKQLFYLIRNFMHMNFSEHTLSMQLETTPAVDLHQPQTFVGLFTVQRHQRRSNFKIIGFYLGFFRLIND